MERNNFSQQPNQQGNTSGNNQNSGTHLIKPFHYENQKQQPQQQGYAGQNAYGNFAMGQFTPQVSCGNPIMNPMSMAQQKHQMDMNSKYVDADIAMRLKQFEYNQKEHFERFKTEMVIKRLNTIEENRQKRELSNRAVFKNSEGKLCFEIITPDGEHIMSRPVIQKTNMKMRLFYSSIPDYDAKYAEISWDGLKEPILLAGDKLSEKGFAKLLIQSGVSIQISREQKKDFVSLALAYLIENATWKEVPYTTGWNLMSDNTWIFETDTKKTLEGMFNAV